MSMAKRCGGFDAVRRVQCVQADGHSGEHAFPLPPFGRPQPKPLTAAARAALNVFDRMTFDADGGEILPNDPMTDLTASAPGFLTPEESARASIAAIDDAASWMADALNNVAKLEDDRALIKPLAVKRIMERFGLAATPAEKIVEQDEEYAAHRSRQRDAEVQKWAAAAAYEAAKLTARLDVALVAMRGEG